MIGIGRISGRVAELRDRILEIYKNAHPSPSLEEGAATGFAETLEEESGKIGLNAPPEYRQLIMKAAEKNGLPANLIDAVIKHESAYKSDAVSPAGARGLMQLMPGTQRELGVSDPFDPAQSIDGGSRYLRMMADRFDGDLAKTLAAYNAGPGAVEKHGGVPPFRETREYVRKILGDLGSDFDGEG